MSQKSWQTKLFYLIIFLIPTNLAKHFILPSSYVSGILVDYLIPTIYLTDILIITLLGLELQQVIFGKGPFLKRSFKAGPYWITRQLLPYAPFFLLLPSIIFASSPIPATYKYSKLILLALFSLWIKQNINFKKHLHQIINVLSLSVLFQSLLALTQWFKQSSIFGYYFFGEQPYTSATTGIDKITWFTGAVKVPPMGTFPHPNVLGGFLAVVLPLIIFQLGSKLRSGKGPFLKRSFKAGPYWITRQLLRSITILLGLTTLFLTFSLSAWLAFLLIGLPLTLINHFKKTIRPIKFIFIYSGLFLILFSFATKFEFLAPQSSFTRRSQLSKIAVKSFLHSPLFGVGLNNFTINMENYGFVTATTRFLQPVHNIYLLILSETGLIGLLGFTYLLTKCLFFDNAKAGPWRITRPPYHYVPLLTLLFLGLFDHYLFTTNQGLLLIFNISAINFRDN